MHKQLAEEYFGKEAASRTFEMNGAGQAVTKVQASANSTNTRQTQVDAGRQAGVAGNTTKKTWANRDAEPSAASLWKATATAGINLARSTYNQKQVANRLTLPGAAEYRLRGKLASPLMPAASVAPPSAVGRRPQPAVRALYLHRTLQPLPFLSCLQDAWAKCWRLLLMRSSAVLGQAGPQSSGAVH